MATTARPIRCACGEVLTHLFSFLLLCATVSRIVNFVAADLFALENTLALHIRFNKMRGSKRQRGTKNKGGGTAALDDELLAGWAALDGASDDDAIDEAELDLIAGWEALDVSRGQGL